MENENTLENLENTEVTAENIPEVIQTIEEATDYSEYFNDIVTRLESLQRVQSNFYNDLIDVSLFALAVIIGLFAFKEFMDRSTRW